MLELDSGQAWRIERQSLASYRAQASAAPPSWIPDRPTSQRQPRRLPEALDARTLLTVLRAIPHADKQHPAIAGLGLVLSRTTSCSALATVEEYIVIVVLQFGDFIERV